MVWHQSPRAKANTGLADELGEALEGEKAVAVGVEDSAALDPSHDDAIQGTRVIETGTTRHANEKSGRR